MNKPSIVGVFLGGISTERNVSIASGLAVATALEEAGYTVKLIDPARGSDSLCSREQLNALQEVPPSKEELASFSPSALLDCIMADFMNDLDIVFIALHGEYGEDGRVQALLDCRGIPYTGSRHTASAVAMDKILTKRLLATVGVPSPPWHIADRSLAEDYDFLEEVRKDLGEHLIVKPNNQGSTVGVTVVESGNLDDIRDAIVEAATYSDDVLIEKFIAGREITVGIVAGEALPIVEIRPDEGFYDYTHKYSKGHTEYICPADFDDYAAEFIQSLALAAHAVTSCSIYSRVDFRVDEDGQPFCLEVNTLPGFTALSLVPKAAAAKGMSFQELCTTIIDLSYSRFQQEDNS